MRQHKHLGLGKIRQWKFVSMFSKMRQHKHLGLRKMRQWKVMSLLGNSTALSELHELYGV
jgi:hypothetical protein